MINKYIQLFLIFNIVLIFLFIFKFSKIESFHSHLPITTIITTCCRKSAPDTSIIVSNINNLLKYCPILTKNVIIIFDGSYIKNNKLHKKCQGKCSHFSYFIYINNVKQKITKLLPNSNIKFIIMNERGCLTNTLKKGIQNSNTEFINIMQEDLIIQKYFDVNNIIKAIKDNNNIDLIRYNLKSNLYHENYNLIRCENTSHLPNKEIIKVNNLILSKSNQYSDNCHITTKTYYYKYIFPNINSHDFMEHSISCQVGKKIPDTIWHLGDYNDGFYLQDKDGRNN